MATQVHDSSAGLPDDLVDRVASGDALLWVGAGPSMPIAQTGPASSPGVPGVRALINALEGRPPEDDPPNWDLAEVATRFVHQHSRDPLNDILRRFYGDPPSLLPPFYERLRSAPDQLRVFVTTNYDPYLRRALTTRDPVVVVRETGLTAVTDAKPVIYHVHGVGSAPDDCVITLGDYAKWEQESWLLRHVSTGEFFSRRTVVMVGYRSRDPHFNRLLASVAVQLRTIQEKPHPIFFVLPGADPSDFGMFDELGLDVVLIPSSGEEFIARMSAQVERKVAGRTAAFLERHLDPPAVRNARLRAAELHADAGAAKPWEMLAELALNTAEELRKGGQLTYAHQELRGAARLFRNAGNSTAAIAALTSSVELALTDLRDAELAELYFPTDAPSEIIDAAEASVRARFYAVVGRAAATGADKERAERFAKLLEQLATNSPMSGWTSECHLIRAVIGITDGAFSVAGWEFGRHADTALTKYEREKSRIYALFFSGLSGEDVVDDLRMMDCHGALEEYRLRALAWLLSHRKSSAEAADVFRRAARAALQTGSVRGAGTSLRGATWAEHRGQDIVLRSDPDSVKAWRLEAAERDSQPEAMTVARLIERTARNLAFGNLREAAIPATNAVTLAWLELDPAGLDTAHDALATIYLHVAEQTGSQDDLHSAAVWLGISGARDRHGRSPRPVEHFERLFRSTAQMGTLTRVVSDLTVRDMDPSRRAGALRVIEVVADLLPLSLVPAVAETALAGLQAGWPINSDMNEAKPACGILLELLDRLDAVTATAFLEGVLRLLDSSPPGAHFDLFTTLGTAIASAPVPPDGGVALARRLVDELRIRSPNDVSKERILVVMATLAERIDDAPKALLRSEIDSADINPTLKLYWRLQANQDVDPNEVTAVLRGLGSAIRRHLEDADRGASWGAAGGYRNAFYRAIVARADTDVCDEVLADALRLIDDSRHLHATRTAYGPLAAYLAKRSVVGREAAVDVFFRIARHGLLVDNAFDRDGRHPFSAIKFAVRTRGQDRGFALSALALIYDGSAPATQTRICEEMLRSAADPDPEVRAAALRQAGYIARHAAETGDALSAISRQAVDALADPDTDVRVAAITAMPDLMVLMPSSERRDTLSLIVQHARSADTPVVVANAAQLASQAMDREIV